MKYIFIFLIKFYQRLISPLLPSSCRFYPSCSQYSLESFQKHGAIKGLWLSVVRILKCGRYHPGGIDHVPDKFHFFSKSK